MNHSALFWLSLNFISIACLAFYSMFEMAAVSFNKLRLHYSVQKGNRRARWLNFLLEHPFRLFGTTLVGVNVATVFGSECARQFHQAIGLSPDLAFFSQVILVILFGDLAPMFAARRFSEHVALTGVVFAYLSSKLLAPVLWSFGWLTKIINFVIRGKRKAVSYFVTRKELEMILERKREASFQVYETEEVDLFTTNLFNLKGRTTREFLFPLEIVPKISSKSTVFQCRKLMKQTQADFLLLYSRDVTNIVGIAFPRLLIRLPDNRPLRDYTKPPWFVTMEMKVVDLLKQFRKNKKNVAVVLDREGHARGVVTMETILEELLAPFGKPLEEKNLLIIDQTFPGDMTVAELEKQFNLLLATDRNLTLSDLMIQAIGHIPEVDEKVFVHSFELIAKETSLLEVKSVRVKTVL